MFNWKISSPNPLTFPSPLALASPPTHMSLCCCFVSFSRSRSGRCNFSSPQYIFLQLQPQLLTFCCDEAYFQLLVARIILLLLLLVHLIGNNWAANADSKNAISFGFVFFSSIFGGSNGVPCPFCERNLSCKIFITHGAHFNFVGADCEANIFLFFLFLLLLLLIFFIYFSSKWQTCRYICHLELS